MLDNAPYHHPLDSKKWCTPPPLSAAKKDLEAWEQRLNSDAHISDIDKFTRGPGTGKQDRYTGQPRYLLADLRRDFKKWRRQRSVMYQIAEAITDCQIWYLPPYTPGMDGMDYLWFVVLS